MTAGLSLEHQLTDIPLTQLFESPKNPRTHYDPEALRLLAENMAAAGQITPAIVRPRPGQAGYEIAAGHRRLRAAKLAGLPTLRSVIREMDDATFAEILNIENLQRDDLNALEEAQGFVTLMTDAGYDVPKIAERVGRSVKYVYDRIKLLQLVPEAKTLLVEGTITAGHGILLARLTKEDQRRALDADSNWRARGGLLEPEMVDEEYFPELAKEGEDGPVKARSVRELQQWIDRNVRFVPAKVDQGDLAFDHPDTADILETARVTETKVVKITREYRVPDEARDEKERTYGSGHWKRADGELEDAEAWGDQKPKKSLTCDHSVVGLVVAGPGRGEAFLVCVNKEKCTVHWAQAMKERAQRAKEREKLNRTTARKAAGDGESPVQPGKPDPDEIPWELVLTWRELELAARAPLIAAAVKAVILELPIAEEICWNLVQDLNLYEWQKVGKRGGWASPGDTEHRDALETLLAPELPGRFQKGSLNAQDGPGARSELAWAIWLARDSKGLDEAIDKALYTRWKAHRAAEAAKVQTSAPAKKAGKRGAP